MTKEAESGKKSMFWHTITVIALMISAVVMVVTGAVYISGLIQDIFGINEVVNLAYDACEGLKTAVTILHIVYGLAMIYLGMERLVTFNAMRVCEGGACALLRHSYLLSILINSSYVILSVVIFGIFRGALLTDVFALYNVPAGLLVLGTILLFVNSAYYEKRVYLFHNYDSGIRVRKKDRK